MTMVMAFVRCIAIPLRACRRMFATFCALSRGVHKRYVFGYIAICEFRHNLKHISPDFISQLVRFHTFLHLSQGYCLLKVVFPIKEDTAGLHGNHINPVSVMRRVFSTYMPDICSHQCIRGSLSSRHQSGTKPNERQERCVSTGSSPKNHAHHIGSGHMIPGLSCLTSPIHSSDGFTKCCPVFNKIVVAIIIAYGCADFKATESIGYFKLGGDSIDIHTICTVVRCHSRAGRIITPKPSKSVSGFSSMAAAQPQRC